MLARRRRRLFILVRMLLRAHVYVHLIPLLLHHVVLVEVQVHSMQIRRTWTTKHSCEKVINPEWPFAYSKHERTTMIDEDEDEEVEEWKGRSSTNRQDIRHVCQTRGVRSKCHICEEIQCGNGNHRNRNEDGNETNENNTSTIDHTSINNTCHFQLQGVSTDDMSVNIPTVSDVPFAIGGGHRYDFGGGDNNSTTHVCMYMTKTYPCQSNFGVDYSMCDVRCWGYYGGGYGNSSTTSRSGLNNNNNTPGPVTIVIPAHVSASTSTSTSTTTTASIMNTSTSLIGIWPNARNDYWKGVNSTPWTEPAPTQSWSYPKHNGHVDQLHVLVVENPNRMIGTSTSNSSRSYYYESHNASMISSMSTSMSTPQGFSFTLAGDKDGISGFRDGYGEQARFNHPEGVAVDHEGYVFVADTGNHAIRMISPRGHVTTLAGNGKAGYKDGYYQYHHHQYMNNNVGSGSNYNVDVIQFSSPSGIAIWRDWQWWPYPNHPIDPDSFIYKNGSGSIVVFVADTGNHRLRKLTFNMTIDESSSFKERKIVGVRVECFSGRCSDEDDSDSSPQAGLADGVRGQARFDSPQGLVVKDSGDIYVADTNNHLIRKVDRFGTVTTLAGTTRTSELNTRGEALEGCPDPCLAGVQGHQDGKSSQAKFSFPTDLTIPAEGVLGGGGNSILVVDRHHLRHIDLIRDKVHTLAGTEHESERDGFGFEASFNKPEGIVATSDGYVYIVDSASCRIRRAFYQDDVLPEVSCSDTLSSLFRPSGCSSYNADIDDFGMKVTPVSGDTYYNFAYRNLTDAVLGGGFVGMGIKDCVGSPPVHNLDNYRWNNGSLVVDDDKSEVREDPNEGTLLTVRCPANCSHDDIVYGFETEQYPDEFYYTEQSPICSAAVHTALLKADEGGIIDVIIVTFQGDPEKSRPFQFNLTNGETVWEFPHNHSQFFIVKEKSPHITVHTISGSPVIQSMNSCGRKDSIPGHEAQFRTPVAVTAFANDTLNDSNRYLFVADRNNNAIRALSASCAFPCENGGRCIGPDQCMCQSGWEGIDCSRPVCSSQCANRELCVGPNTCACIPGYTGDDCTNAQCIQTCENGGFCSAPDTCSCPSGWFDTNCTTPVCSQTCGNGGNCTGPDFCSCPTNWKGDDCRTPVCEQECKNGGFCVAPNSCQCPPDWSGFDCSQPVCHQGHFEAFGEGLESEIASPKFWLEYRPCNMSAWCSATNAFECSQKEMLMRSAIPLGGAQWRHKIGKLDLYREPCSLLELRSDVVTWYQYLRSLDNSTTSYQRYSNITTFDWRSLPHQEWNAILQPEKGFTGPWSHRIDRQVALAELYNVTQGRYRCANGGHCVAPDTCACARGWMGYDCRVPICEQGYYEESQGSFVPESNDDRDLEVFGKFLLGSEALRLNPANGGYSNPEYQIVVERFVNESFISRTDAKGGGNRYLKYENMSMQGGYECSIRSVTEWEDYRSNYLFEHPNYYSRYMDQKVEGDGNNYTSWKAMGWDPTYYKSAPLELPEALLLRSNKTGRIFVYTNEGYRRKGTWSKTGSKWMKGRCIIEFKRTCNDEEKAHNLHAIEHDISGESTLIVQDTDLSFRPRVNYSNDQAYLKGAWKVEGGECIDHVIRGCFNNGTCVGPNECLCAPGWDGYDCTEPICHHECFNHGNCTLPGICTCEKGWTGNDCSIPICAQDCNNGGTCIAPDTCKCQQWESRWRDGRSKGGVPLFQIPNGDPQLTGWTGYDCGTPICTQAERFLFNINEDSNLHSDLVPLGGHGKDGKLPCYDVKCPEYDETVVTNDGRSFQTGCGHDPIITGCCFQENSGIDEDSSIDYQCFRCKPDQLEINSNFIRCADGGFESIQFQSVDEVTNIFKEDGIVRMCGPVHNPGGNDYFISIDPYAGPYWSNRNSESNFTSNSFLCQLDQWAQGDFIGDAGLGEERGVGGDIGLKDGRHTRINFNNYVRDDQHDEIKWEFGGEMAGEGIYACYNGGSCIAPDVCTCRDGYEGFDCKTPTCRHEQVDGKVVGCLNGGICMGKDNCQCVQMESSLWLKYANAERGITGWMGPDCSMPMCAQGYFDPLCEDNPFAKGGNGCYRCPNGGLCTAPDVCQCSEGWTGFNCNTPICEAVATPLIRKQLMTMDENKVRIFERDPCGMNGFDTRIINPDTSQAPRGVCTLPNQCTCYCKETYDSSLCRAFGGKFCIKPFFDRLFRHRNVLAPNESFGTRSCYSGYEGAVDDKDRFISCHLTIYEPNSFIKNSVPIFCWGTLITIILVWSLYHCVNIRHEDHLRRTHLMRKHEKAGVSPNQNSFSFQLASARSKSKDA